MNEPDKTLETLTAAFERMGAPQSQARVMASQLLKRAQQIARERAISESAALEELLGKVASGRRGEYTGEASPSGQASS